MVISCLSSIQSIFSERTVAEMGCNKRSSMNCDNSTFSLGAPLEVLGKAVSRVRKVLSSEIASFPNWKAAFGCEAVSFIVSSTR